MFLVSLRYNYNFLQVSTPSVDDTDTTIPNRSPPEVTMEMTNGVTLTEERKSSSSRRQSDAIDWKWQIARAESVDYGMLRQLLR